MYQLFCMPMLFITAMWTHKNRCDPISRTNTGSVRAAAKSTSRLNAASSAVFFAADSSDMMAVSAAARASYPASAIAPIRAARSAVPVTVARSVARLTLATVTPGTVFKARSTRATQEAQVIPSMTISIGRVGTS